METVITFLRKYLLVGSSRNITLRKKILLLLNELAITKDIDYKRFFTSLAIDIKSGVISKTHVWNLINEIDFKDDGSQFLSAFDKTLASNMEKYYHNSPFTDIVFKKDTYAVLLYWSKIFLKYRNAKERTSLPLSWAEEDMAYRGIFL